MKELRIRRIRLIHDGVEPGQPLGAPLRFGLQDKAGAVNSLPGIGWHEIEASDQEDGCVAADVRGRRPHLGVLVAWAVAPAAVGAASTS